MAPASARVRLGPESTGIGDLIIAEWASDHMAGTFQAAPVMSGDRPGAVEHQVAHFPGRHATVQAPGPRSPHRLTTKLAIVGDEILALRGDVMAFE
jgi:hypothetical protein